LERAHLRGSQTLIRTFKKRPVGRYNIGKNKVGRKDLPDKAGERRPRPSDVTPLKGKMYICPRQNTLA